MDVFVARSLTAIRSHTSFFGDTDLKECIDATLSASARATTRQHGQQSRAEDAGLTRDAQVCMRAIDRRAPSPPACRGHRGCSGHAQADRVSAALEETARGQWRLHASRAPRAPGSHRWRHSRRRRPCVPCGSCIPRCVVGLRLASIRCMCQLRCTCHGWVMLGRVLVILVQGGHGCRQVLPPLPAGVRAEQLQDEGHRAGCNREADRCARVRVCDTTSSTFQQHL